MNNKWNLIPLVFVFLGFVLVYSGVHVSRVKQDNINSSLSKLGTINQAYDRVQVCVISVNPNLRTPEYVKSCYDLVEKQLGVKIERYGDGAK